MKDRSMMVVIIENQNDEGEIEKQLGFGRRKKKREKRLPVGLKSRMMITIQKNWKIELVFILRRREKKNVMTQCDADYSCPDSVISGGRCRLNTAATRLLIIFP